MESSFTRESISRSIDQVSLELQSNWGSRNNCRPGGFANEYCRLINKRESLSIAFKVFVALFVLFAIVAIISIFKGGSIWYMVVTIVIGLIALCLSCLVEYTDHELNELILLIKQFNSDFIDLMIPVSVNKPIDKQYLIDHVTSLAIACRECISAGAGHLNLTGDIDEQIFIIHRATDRYCKAVNGAAKFGVKITGEMISSGIATRHS